ncbi:oligoendopeptidase F [Clostridium sp. PL3]|uniref:Oligopeptidase F n=1 Tax=Clostridium thailandense TaxID=2794346 RepID=A0A949TIH8_9CLOT|nr:oligoendopeptidase F [Clostridium thailandense]MBV7272880.1 oligoendopeptidase F [Clostridium thailandense]
MGKVLKERKDIDQSLTWDLSAIYATDEKFQSAVKEMKELALKMEKDYKGKLNAAGKINECLDELRKLYQFRDLTGSYVELLVAVDYANNENQDKYSKITNIISDIDSRLSFIKSEIIQGHDEILEAAINMSKENSNYLKDIKREKAHALHPEAERVLAALSGALEAPYQVYEQAKHADMDFKSFTVNGIEYPLGYALFENEYEYENDTKVRRAAFKAFSDKLREYQYTTAAAYQVQVQKEKNMATLRGFDSVIDSLLFPQKVDSKLYNRQIDLITEKLALHMRKYAKLLKKVHKLDEMTFADLKIAVDPEYDPNVTIEQSKKYIEGALAVLGDDYLEMVKKAYNERWIDFAQNKGKSTGGFCASPYGSHSFILLSWSEKMAEVFTLAHELGHAGHFKLCNESQNIFDVNVSTYFVEAPSTMNELLMANYLLKINEDKRFRRWVLSSMIGHTYYHNFITHLLEAAYQREVYRIIDEGGSVQASTLSKIKKEVLEKFWGEDVKIIDGAELTWMRQPHYYMGLYSYTYSAGLTIATEVSKRILKEGQRAIDDWRAVLRAGSTKTPVELAQMAGVDITTDKPLFDTIEHIGSIIDEIVKLTEEIEA